MNRDIRLEMRYPHSLERVWHALTDREALALWLMPNTFESQVGHQFEFRTRPALGFDGIVRCQVTILEPQHRLAYTWLGGAMNKPTMVTWTLEAENTSTKVILEHTGFEGIGGIAISYLLGNGWQRMLQNALSKILE